MPESLLSPSQIKMFGRLFDGLALRRPSEAEVDPNPAADPVSSPDSPNPPCGSPPLPDPSASFDLLANQLLRENSTLARIYGYTYEGEYYALPRPTVFLVHGEGRRVDSDLSGMLDRSGVAARDWAFEADVRYWEYDRINYSLRCDIVTGTLDDILIDACVNADDNEGTASDMAARSNLSSRSNLSARSNLNARSNLSARSNLNARHRMR